MRHNRAVGPGRAGDEEKKPIVWAKESKSQLKRDAAAKQDLGEELLALPAGVLARFPLADALREALRAARDMKGRGGRRRQMQHIGALMRQEDCDRIRELLALWKDGNRQGTAQLNQVKAWRDAIVLGSDEAVDEVLLAIPSLPRDSLVSLAASARKEQAEARPPRDGRRLFRLIRDGLGAREETP
jgi:ribosome-associated protein